MAISNEQTSDRRFRLLRISIDTYAIWAILRTIGERHSFRMNHLFKPAKSKLAREGGFFQTFLMEEKYSVSITPYDVVTEELYIERNNNT
jgi:hypothetical protein